MQPPFLRLVPVVFAALLAACGGGGAPGGATTASTAAPATPGARLYMQNCIACHGREGEGVPGIQPALAGTAVTIGDSGPLLAWVMYGVRPETLPRGQYRGVMPQFAYLSNEEMAALLTHVRTSWGNAASPVTPEQVAQARAAHGK